MTEQEIALLARKKIDESNILRSFSIKIKVIGSRLILIGKVDSFHTKQLAQEEVRKTPGVTLIENQIEVHEFL